MYVRSEQELLREEMEAVKSSRERLQARVGELEDEMKKIPQMNEGDRQRMEDDVRS